jgi:5-methylcytosine-specific restriction protein A
MATYLFAWNPAIWNWPELAADIRKLARRGHLATRWSCGRHRNIEPGSRAFLVRLGVPPKGIFGSGVTLTAPAAGRHWIAEKATAGIPTNYTTLRLDALFGMPLVTFDELAVPPFRRFRWGVRSSGTYLPESIADALEDLWAARVAVAASRSRPQTIATACKRIPRTNRLA